MRGRGEWCPCQGGPVLFDMIKIVPFLSGSHAIYLFIEVTLFNAWKLTVLFPRESGPDTSKK